LKIFQKDSNGLRPDLLARFLSVTKEISIPGPTARPSDEFANVAKPFADQKAFPLFSSVSAVLSWVLWYFSSLRLVRRCINRVTIWQLCFGGLLVVFQSPFVSS